MKQLTAIVVDDDKGVAMAFSIAMRHVGFTVEPITDSTIALAEIEKTRPDVVILDVNMPVVSGIDILRAIRSNPELARTKVIMATASGMITQDDNVAELADLVLLKPISLTQITTFATRFAEQSREATNNPPSLNRFSRCSPTSHSHFLIIHASPDAHRVIQSR